MAGIDDFDAAIEESHLATGAFVTGDPEPLKALYSHGDDAVIANPFGPPSRGWKQAAETLDRAALNFADGEVVGFESVVKCATPDLAYFMEIERYKVKVGGSEEPTAVDLRVTTILRPEDGAWRIIHRHADPITTARTAESVVQKA